MKERPILFSGPMVKAILDGRKTQTRRVVRPKEWANPAGRPLLNRCPYGAPGDKLWVRESWRPRQPGAVYYRADSYDYQHDELRAGGAVPQWRPSIHMPRWASRITLEVMAVRVERLQEISPDEATAEGAIEWATRCGRNDALDGRVKGIPYPINTFAELWDSINAKRTQWLSNPWVWVIEFRMTKDAKE